MQVEVVQTWNPWNSSHVAPQFYPTHLSEKDIEKDQVYYIYMLYIIIIYVYIRGFEVYTNNNPPKNGRERPRGRARPAGRTAHARRNTRTHARTHARTQFYE